MSSPIICLINAKGGSGATTLCIELAKATRREGSVTIVDGDVSGRRNMAVILDVVQNFNHARASDSYSLIQTNGITAVELADSLDNAFMIRQDEIEGLVDSISGVGAVIVDLPTPFTAVVRPFIASATRVVIVLEPNLLGTAAARSLIADLSKFGIPQERLALLTNLRGGRAEITSRELERALRAPVFAEIPIRTDRNFQSKIDQLAKRFAALPAEAPLEALRPSVRGLQASTTPGAGAGSGAAPESKAQAGAAARVASANDRLKAEVHEALSKRIDVVAASRAHSDGQKLAELRAQIGEITAQLLAERPDINSVEERAQIRQEVIDEVLGLGPLEDLMRDPAVSEIMVNGPDHIYVERGGKLTLSGKKFTDERQLRNIIERIVAPLGRRIDESSPMVDARLPDGSRVNAIIEPVALNGGTITIRRFSTKRLNIQDLVNFGALSEQCVDLLRGMVEAHLNMVVSGGTGSGKTTFLNILSGFIPETDRILTIEDAAELKLSQDHVVRLEARPANAEGKGAVTIRDLVKNSLRMRPDRIVIGECRGGEAFDMLQAMNTGHDGSLTTLHANNPREAIARLQTLVLMAGFELPISAINQQIAGAVDVVVQCARLRDGSRKIMSITEVVGMEGNIVTMQEIIKFKEMGTDAAGKVIGEFQYTGVQPSCMQRFEEMGIEFDPGTLSKMSSAGALW